MNDPKSPIQKPREYTPEEADAEAIRRYEELQRNPDQPTRPAEKVFAAIRRKLGLR